jgi:hypothetical protein
VADRLGDVAAQLAGIADTLADAALDRLREATESLSRGGEPDRELLAEERRITRARRAVEKAVALLDPEVRADAGDPT